MRARTTLHGSPLVHSYSIRAQLHAGCFCRCQYVNCGSPRNLLASECAVPPPHSPSPRVRAWGAGPSVLTCVVARAASGGCLGHAVQVASVQGQRRRVQVEASRERHRYDCEHRSTPSLGPPHAAAVAYAGVHACRCMCVEHAAAAATRADTPKRALVRRPPFSSPPVVRSLTSGGF